MRLPLLAMLTKLAHGSNTIDSPLTLDGYCFFAKYILFFSGIARREIGLQIGLFDQH
jgi:hypothetical protein